MSDDTFQSFCACGCSSYMLLTPMSFGCQPLVSTPSLARQAPCSCRTHCIRFTLSEWPSQLLKMRLGSLWNSLSPRLNGIGKRCAVTMPPPRPRVYKPVPSLTCSSLHRLSSSRTFQNFGDADLWCDFVWGSKMISEPTHVCLLSALKDRKEGQKDSWVWVLREIGISIMALKSRSGRALGGDRKDKTKTIMCWRRQGKG